MALHISMMGHGVLGLLIWYRILLHVAEIVGDDREIPPVI